MKVIVAGSRDFSDYFLLEKHLDEIKTRYGITEIVSGTARGADKLGEIYAKLHDIPIKQFPADWNRYGKRAGYLRNKEMAEYADACICFWINGSKGTKMMIDLAKEYKIRLRVVEL